MHHGFPLAAVFVLISLLGCSNKAGTGALAGAGTGAVAGGLVTGSVGGVLIGGAAGAITGAVIGASLDESDRELLNKESPKTVYKIEKGEQLSLEDIKKMAKAGLSDQVIISQIEATKSVFYLNTADLVDLKKAGISQEVINYMINTE